MIDWEQFPNEAAAVEYLKSAKDISCTTTAQARQYLRSHIPKESYYQDKIIRHIRSLFPDAFVWKATAGAYSRQGIPDVCAVINGRYYGFEVKRPLIGVLSKIQEQTIKRINAAGGNAYVVTSTDQVTEILNLAEEGNRMDVTIRDQKKNRTLRLDNIERIFEEAGIEGRLRIVDRDGFVFTTQIKPGTDIEIQGKV